MNKYAEPTCRGFVHFIEPVAVPPKPAAGGRGEGGGTRTGGKAWDLRDLCKELNPNGSWDDVTSHTFKTLPVVIVDLLVHESLGTAALGTLAGLNQ